MFPFFPYDPVNQLPLTAAGITTFLICLLIVFTQRWHGHLTLDHLEGVQKFHLSPTPRVGGLAVFAGLCVGCSLAPVLVATPFQQMLIASLPAMISGVIEDMTKRAKVTERLLATMASGGLAAWMMDISLSHLNIPGIDFILGYPLFAILFTAFAVGGVANAINMIDGFNGLAAGTILISLTAIGAIAFQVGDPVLAKLCFVIGGATLGFLLINFPFGKIFLGDGGAYLLGFLLAWLAVMLPMRNPSVSPWAGLLACGYPVLEAFFSMARRIRRAHSPGQPDRLHLHSLIKARFIRTRFKTLPATFRNSAVSPFLWAFSALPASCAILFYSQTVWLASAFLFSALVYMTAYGRLIYFRWKFPHF